MKTLAYYKEQFLNLDNAKEYAQTQDKFIYVQDLTDLPIESRILEALDLAFWDFCVEHDLLSNV